MCGITWKRVYFRRDSDIAWAICTFFSMSSPATTAMVFGLNLISLLTGLNVLIQPNRDRSTAHTVRCANPLFIPASPSELTGNYGDPSLVEPHRQEPVAPFKNATSREFRIPPTA